MEGTDKESKTEVPSEKRLTDAADEGNVPVSREVPMAMSVLVFAAVFAVNGETMLRDMGGLLAKTVQTAVGNEPLSNRDFAVLFNHLGLAAGVVLAPLFGFLVLSGLVSSLAQNEPRMVGKRITPQFSRVSPMAGWKRLFSGRGLAEFAKSIAKLLAAVLVTSAIALVTLKDVMTTMFQSPGAMAQTVFAMVTRLLFWVGAIAGVVAAVDLIWQRRRWWTELKMTRQEVKDEFKQTEGDPVIKSRLRSLGRDRARNRMMKSVPTATLIIANPTHFAVALRYDREKDAAPVVVATGQDHLALRIRAIAEEHQVPVFERVELARALYKVVKVDQIIPPQFYKALAELIRAIYAKQEF